MFQDLLKKYIVKNEHRVTVEMKPDAQLEGEVAQNEASKLSTIKDSLTPAQIEEVGRCEAEARGFSSIQLF